MNKRLNTLFQEIQVQKFYMMQIFNSRWHPKLGSKIVCLDENKSDGYDTCEQAIEAARLFKEHCKIYLV